jgi:membrane protease subunit HflC
MNRALRNPIALAILAIVTLVLIGSTLFVVPEDKQAVVIRFGEPQRIINRFQSGSNSAITVPASRCGCRSSIPSS